MLIGRWLNPFARTLKTAYKKFSDSTVDVSCFEVYIEEFDNEVVVSFLFKNKIILDGDAIKMGNVDLTACGLQKSYYFDKKVVVC